MRNFMICIFILFSQHVCSQNIDLKPLVNKIYDRDAVESFVTEKVCYVIPWEINIIDTTTNINAPINVSYFMSTGSFKKYLGKVKKAMMLRLRFEAVTNSKILMTVSLAEVRDENYTDSLKLFEYVDQRKVLLRFNRKSKQWLYEKTIGVTKDFTPIQARE